MLSLMRNTARKDKKESGVCVPESSIKSDTKRDMIASKSFRSMTVCLKYDCKFGKAMLSFIYFKNKRNNGPKDGFFLLNTP